VDSVTDRLGSVDLQRAVGQLAVSIKRRGEVSVLDRLRQVGCLKARFPRPDDPRWLNVVTLNTSGGIAGGDALDAAFAVGARARVTIATQAAERFYRTLPGGTASNVRTRLSLGEAAAAEWLPQETILFDRCAIHRHLHVELAADAWFLGVECLVFGRTAMGEIVRTGLLHDDITVRRGGRLLLHDAIRLHGDVAAILQRPAIGDGARAVATIVHVAPDAESALDSVRAASPQCAASAWDGMLVARLLADDGASLRAAVTAVLQTLRGGRALPRVWLC
jgi:urease accessory protein